MYTDEQQIDHIRGLQQDLRVIQAACNDALPKVSGIYDSLTENAVRCFQERSGLPVTGKTDLSTWDRIVQESNRIRSQTALPLAVRIFPNAAQTVGPGDRGRFLYILQAILNGLIPQIPSLLPLAYTGVYDTATERAIAVFQRTSGLPPTGKLDADTWNSIAHLYSYVGVRDDNFLDTSQP